MSFNHVTLAYVSPKSRTNVCVLPQNMSPLIRGMIMMMVDRTRENSWVKACTRILIDWQQPFITMNVSVTCFWTHDVAS